MEDIKVEELIFGDQWISDMKSVVGADMTLKIYISPGGKDQTVWNDEKQEDIKTLTKEPADWQYLAMRRTFNRVNDEFGLTIKEVSNESQSDVQIKVSTVPNSSSVNGEWVRSWDNSGVNDIQLFMSYQAGIMLSGDPPKAPYDNPNNAIHTAMDRSVWEKIFIHEMGHLLGLEHPWDKPDGDWAVENDQVKTIDTVMGNYHLDEDGNVMDWYQEIDIKALQQIWGTGSRPNQIDIDETGTSNNDVNPKQIGRLYTAAFGRVPDEGGLQYWINVVNDPLVNYKDVSQNFVDSPEFSLIASPNSSSDVFATALYQNVLGRAPDSSGLGYWTNQLNSGLQDRADILIGFAESPENVALYETLV